MKLETRACPECMAPARGTVERLAGVAEFTDQQHGSVEYSGYTDVGGTRRRRSGTTLGGCS